VTLKCHIIGVHQLNSWVCTENVQDDWLCVYRRMLVGWRLVSVHSCHRYSALKLQQDELAAISVCRLRRKFSGLSIELHHLYIIIGRDRPKFGFGYGAETGNIFSSCYGRNPEAWFRPTFCYGQNYVKVSAWTKTVPVIHSPAVLCLLLCLQVDR